ncbi:hypothetical protein ABFX02_10G054800 [Erythranthe guttata]
MATMSTYFLTAATKPHSLTIFPKPFKTLRFEYLTPPPSVVLPPPTKFRSRKASVPVIRASTTSSSSSSSTCVDVETISTIRPGGIVESDRLPSDVRKRAMDAIDSGGRRVTIGDVASKAGLMLHEAQKSLQALAADANGFLEVSDEGDVLYVFPMDYRSKLAAKSFWMRTEPLLEKGKMAAKNLVKVTFGAVLVASIVIVFTAIIVIMASGSSKSKSRKSSRSSRRYKDTSSEKENVRYGDGGKEFIESVFSFVFGDGDPNQGIEETRWKLIGQYIASNGGVVAAEELAPYLDLETTKIMEDESYILPVLLRFDGQPEVDEEGNILYIFPSLQRTAAPQRRGPKEDVERRCHQPGEVKKFLKETDWQFSKTTAFRKAMVIGFGGLNLAGVIILGAMLKDTTVVEIRFISFVSAIFPLLQIYAGSFFAIPLARWLFVLITNGKISKRNQAREHCAKALESPDLPLRWKISSARDMAQRTFISEDRIVYSTGRDLHELNYDNQVWERRFEEVVKSD